VKSLVGGKSSTPYRSSLDHACIEEANHPFVQTRMAVATSVRGVSGGAAHVPNGAVTIQLIRLKEGNHVVTSMTRNSEARDKTPEKRVWRNN
jgi:hypothetical protein